MAFPLFTPRRAPLTEPALGPKPGMPANSRTPAILGAGAAHTARGREVAALLFWTLAVFLILALASYQGEPASSSPILDEAATKLTGANWVGSVGEAFARGLVSLCGIIAWAFPLEAVLLGVPFVRGKKSLLTPTRVAGDVVLLILAASMVQVGWPQKLAFGKHAAGGMFGELFGELLRSLFSTVGSFLVGFALLALLLIARATFSFIALVHGVERTSKACVNLMRTALARLAGAWRTARDVERQKRVAETKEPLIDRENHDDAQIAVLPADDDDLVVASGLDATPETLDVAVAPSKVSDAEAPKPARKKRKTKAEREAELQAEAAAASRDEDDEDDESDETQAAPDEQEDDEDDEEEPAPAEVDASVLVTEAPAPKSRSAKGKKKPVVEDGPTIVDTSAALEKVAPVKERLKTKAGPRAFLLPSIDFLVPAKHDPSMVIDEVGLRRSSELLVKTLADYKVVGTVEEIHPGPVVTTFEVSPVAGTKVSRVASLADDLALALAKKVRIVAPIPGKNRIGFELPNERRIPVNLRDLVEDRRFQSLDVPLPVVLGRDIVGNPVYADLASMPHVIVAGATGAGKSVGLNVMLTSLLYRRSPEELRMLMIDPKVVELAPFDRIPHMLLPVVTDMKQAATALKWAVDEMERRYQLFADAGTKNIGTYNGWVGKVARGEVKNPNAAVVMAKDHNGFSDAVPAREGEGGEIPLPEAMPFIVIVVDEFADLMMQQGKEVETSVARLAQKARAAGMHVILATQRPSVDVITGMIKANFPTRIAFRVAQKIDSRTILDEQGAEHLLGRGDMLIKLNGTNDTKRVQCPWVSEEEVQLVTDHLRKQGEPVYDENILKPRDDEEGGADEDDGEQDAMYDQAVRLVSETRRCSTSWLQRKLGLGYNRAARIVETMERRGLVGPANGAKDREVFVEAV
jgi:DNA segregation ATPase FtsK/SpoIIIE, S-DNA-T family